MVLISLQSVSFSDCNEAAEVEEVAEGAEDDWHKPQQVEHLLKQLMTIKYSNVSSK